MTDFASRSSFVSAPSGEARGSALAAAGELVGAYILTSPLGRGAYGEVWRAIDPHGQEVALKLLFPMSEAQRRRVVREINALEALPIEGVVRLLDHGESNGRIYLVMNLIKGKPFGSGDWTSVRATALRLLETLARVHESRIAHRDLKPANILVQDDGAPVILDFGLAQVEEELSDLTRAGETIGTVPYASPEQLLGRHAGAPSDIYSLGLMLYEALHGAPPHRTDSLEHLRYDRLLGGPPPFGHLPSATLRADGETIARMLASEPDQRPDAREVLRQLRGAPIPSATKLPRLGPGGLPEAIATRVRRGERVLVDGPSGSGRTRLLQDVAALLDDAIYWTVRAERPYASLAKVLGEPPHDVARAEARGWVLEALGRLERPLLVDDPERLDPWTRAALATATLPCGAVELGAGPDAVRLAPLTVEEIHPLFAGPDRLLHLREDGAHALHRRTGGLPARVVEQVNAWTRAGVLRPSPEGFQISRRDLERLDAESAWPAPAQSGPALSPPLEELLRAVCFASPNARLDVLEALLPWPRWELELCLEALVERGAATTDGERWWPRRASLASVNGDAQRWHQRVAERLSPGTPRRLEHLLYAGAEGVEEEALVLLGRFEERGDRAGAVAFLQRALRLRPQSPILHAALARTFIDANDVEAMKRAAATALSAGHHAIAELLDLAVLAAGQQGEEVLPRLRALGPFEDPRLEMSRLATIFTAAILRNHDMERLLAELSMNPTVLCSPEHRARWRSWLGLLRFRQGRYQEAAELQEAASWDREPAGRMVSLANATRARLMDRDADGLNRIADELDSLAQERRACAMEAFAARMKRAAANLRGATTPDLDLVAAARHLDDPGILSEILLTEAFIAFRGRHPAAATLAQEAQASWERRGRPVAALHAAALRFALTREGAPESIAANIRHWPGNQDVILDVLALLTLGGYRPAIADHEIRELLVSHPLRLRPFPVGALSPGQALETLDILEA